MNKKLYVYLSKVDFVDTWVNGGYIPICKASNYKKEERNGVYTPDEVTQIRINGDVKNYKFLDELKSVINFDESASININVSGNLTSRNGDVLATNFQFQQSHKDGLVLCFSVFSSLDVMNRFGNKLAVVEINDILFLKEILDWQIGNKSMAGFCTYTNSDVRDTFIKSCHDSWQGEFRFFWENILENKTVLIPKGISVDITDMIK